MDNPQVEIHIFFFWKGIFGIADIPTKLTLKMLVQALKQSML